MQNVIDYQYKKGKNMTNFGINEKMIYGSMESVSATVKEGIDLNDERFALRSKLYDDKKELTYYYNETIRLSKIIFTYFDEINFIDILNKLQDVIDSIQDGINVLDGELYDIEPNYPNCVSYDSLFEINGKTTWKKLRREEINEYSNKINGDVDYE
jgi:hypothetical protein